MAWANAWNEHVLTIRSERQCSPKDMFVFGMVQNGIRGYDDTPIDGDPPFNLDEFGIDWHDYNSNLLQAHHNANNPPDGDMANPFQTHLPHHFSHVDVPEAASPFSTYYFDIFQLRVQPLMSSGPRNMVSRRSLWTSALAICNEIFA